jgi:hypothetical protein
MAESMPSDASDAISIDEEHSQVQEDVTLLLVLLESTKLTWVSASKCQSVVAHVCMHLMKIVLLM